MINSVFSSADILLPEEYLLPYWSVVACDQFTSQPEYWQRVKDLTAEKPSSYSLILPEAEIDTVSQERIGEIHRTMDQYLKRDFLRSCPDCFVYTERQMQNGLTRRGLIGKVDLTQYDYSGSTNLPVRATEETVHERIPPRMGIRRGASLELPHVLLLCEDDQNQIHEPLSRNKAHLKKLYDFDLMLQGGHVSGWLVDGKEKDDLQMRVRLYEENQKKKYSGERLFYAVGDGNHSLATAKACYEELRTSHPGMDWSSHPSRWALCELNNIYDEAQCFEPIHRLVKHCDSERLIADLQKAFHASEGVVISYLSSDQRGQLRVDCSTGCLPLAVLQGFLDSWLKDNPGTMDYIHGEDALTQLSNVPGSVGFLLPTVEKNTLFPGILSHGVLPRKTFSMGAATEKRYYLELRKIC